MQRASCARWHGQAEGDERHRLQPTLGVDRRTAEEKINHVPYPCSAWNYMCNGHCPRSGANTYDSCSAVWPSPHFFGEDGVSFK
mmetsp:Transcript_75789/g.225958  ORF Transcript_75789/g.225958 Transcript_75789/m.225958 type:complete len:84 (+) Transcript_75789:3-254(+)